MDERGKSKQVVLVGRCTLQVSPMEDDEVFSITANSPSGTSKTFIIDLRAKEVRDKVSAPHHTDLLF